MHTGLLYRLALPLLMLLLSACDGVDRSDHSDRSPVGGQDDFYAQPHWAEYLQGLPSDASHQPELSGWERVEALEQSERLEDEDFCADPEEVMQAWAEARDLLGPAQAQGLEVDIRTRERDGDTVDGLLQRWGFKDDSIAGIDHSVRFQREGECLAIQRVDARHYCRRGVERRAICL